MCKIGSTESHPTKQKHSMGAFTKAHKTKSPMSKLHAALQKRRKSHYQDRKKREISPKSPGLKQGGTVSESIRRELNSCLECTKDYLVADLQTEADDVSGGDPYGTLLAALGKLIDVANTKPCDDDGTADVIADLTTVAADDDEFQGMVRSFQKYHRMLSEDPDDDAVAQRYVRVMDAVVQRVAAVRRTAISSHYEDLDDPDFVRRNLLAEDVYLQESVILPLRKVISRCHDDNVYGQLDRLFKKQMEAAIGTKRDDEWHSRDTATVRYKAALDDRDSDIIHLLQKRADLQYTLMNLSFYVV